MSRNPLIASVLIISLIAFGIITFKQKNSKVVSPRVSDSLSVTITPQMSENLPNNCDSSSMPLTDNDLNEIVGGTFTLKYAQPIIQSDYKGYKCHYTSDQHESDIVIFDNSDSKAWNQLIKIRKPEDVVTGLGDEAFKGDPNYDLIVKKGNKVLEIMIGYPTTPHTNRQPLLRKLVEQALPRMN